MSCKQKQKRSSIGSRDTTLINLSVAPGRMTIRRRHSKCLENRRGLFQLLCSLVPSIHFRIKTSSTYTTVNPNFYSFIAASNYCLSSLIHLSFYERVTSNNISAFTHVFLLVCTHTCKNTMFVITTSSGCAVLLKRDTHMKTTLPTESSCLLNVFPPE